MTSIHYIDPEYPVFPDTSAALTVEPAGLLAVGGNLAPATILNAYRSGIFPWYSPGEPILWWSPAPRMMLAPADAHFPRSLKKLARKRPYTISVNRAFDEVIQRCANVPRKGQDGTWISQEMIEAYTKLHQLGHAHSVETWQDDTLIGGLYGISIGKAFFGESMFSLADGASKVAFASLCRQLYYWQYELIDCQVYTPLLSSFGAELVSRKEFERKLAHCVAQRDNFDWRSNWSLGEFGFDGS